MSEVIWGGRKATITAMAMAIGASSAHAQRPTMVEGDVYLVTQAGEIRQGAANEVMLIPQADSLSTGWEELCAAQRSESERFMTDRTAESERRERQIDGISASAERVRTLQTLIAFNEETIAELLARVRRDSEARESWVRSHSVASSPTGMQAHYRIEAQAGDYWLFSHMQIGNDARYWVVPITLQRNVTLRRDLDNNNALQPAGFNCDHNPLGER